MKARFLGDGLGLPLITGTQLSQTRRPPTRPNLNSLLGERRFVLPPSDARRAVSRVHSQHLPPGQLSLA